MNIALGILAIFTILTLAFVGFLYYLFLAHPRTSLDEMPLSIGAKGDDFEVLECAGIPILIENSLPYPTYFNSTNSRKKDLGGTWKMRFDPKQIGLQEKWFSLKKTTNDWLDINVPSTFNTAYSENVRYEGITWFYKEFVADEYDEATEWPRFGTEGILLRSKVWLNGQFIGGHNSGWTPFFLDFSNNLLKGQTNKLIICTDNQHDYDTLPTRLGTHHIPGWHNYGGLFRELFLDYLPKHYIFKVQVSGEVKDKTGIFKVSVVSHNRWGQSQARIICSVKGPGLANTLELTSDLGSINTGFIAGNFDFSIDDPKMWSHENPNLYDFTVRLENEGKSHVVELKSGFRTIEQKDGDILLNGKPVFLKGICKHEDHPEFGATNPEHLFNKDLEQIQQMECNYVRLAHYPHHPKELDKAAEMGLMMGEEIPYYQPGTGFVPWYSDKQPLRRFPVRNFGLKQLYNKKLLLNAQRELIEMVERDRNNPAIIIWGVANESYTLGKKAAEVYRWFRDVVRSFDSTRLTTVAELTYDIPLLDNRRDSSYHMDVASFNIYTGWYYNDLESLEEHLERMHRKFPDKPILLSEFGAEAMVGRTEKDGIYDGERVLKKRTYSEDYQEKLIQHYVKLALEKPYIVGVSPWVFSDFYCSEFPNNPVPYFNIKGVVSKDREPKKSYHLLKRMFNDGKSI